MDYHRGVHSIPFLPTLKFNQIHISYRYLERTTLAKIFHRSINHISMRINVAHKWYCVAFVINHLECDRIIMLCLPLYLILALFIATLSFDWIAYFYSEILNNQWVKDALQFIAPLPDSGLWLGCLTVNNSLSEWDVSGGVKWWSILVQIRHISWNWGSSVINVIRHCLIDSQIVRGCRRCLSIYLRFWSIVLWLSS